MAKRFHDRVSREGSAGIRRGYASRVLLLAMVGAALQSCASTRANLDVYEFFYLPAPDPSAFRALHQRRQLEDSLVSLGLLSVSTEDISKMSIENRSRLLLCSMRVSYELEYFGDDPDLFEEWAAEVGVDTGRRAPEARTIEKITIVMYDLEQREIYEGRGESVYSGNKPSPALDAALEDFRRRRVDTDSPQP